MTGRLAGKVALITGAARGIGEATAELLASQGATVALGDLDQALVQQVADRIGRGAVGARLDVTSAESWQAFLVEVGEVGPIDVLVNNAGIMPLGSVLKEPDAVTRAIIDVNVHGLINGTKAVAPGMVERGRGHILNVASAVGRLAVPDGATYSASKFAVVGFSEAIRQEFEPLGIDVSLILPTVVQTELAAGVPAAKGMKAVTADDVAKAIESVVRKPRAEVWVPNWVQGPTKFTQALPRKVQDLLAKTNDAATVLTQADPVARAAYEERARRNEKK
jgi:NADP-dependent 3-hydroxy acid dehydrogenase YdfG